MQQRLVLRYSMSFKRQVVSELESGRFDSILQASEHYGISGSEPTRCSFISHFVNIFAARK